MKNKEVIDSLTNYFLSQTDVATVCRALASCMIDYHRLANWAHITPEERDSLTLRIEMNSEELEKFVEEGSTKPLELRKVELLNEEKE